MGYRIVRMNKELFIDLMTEGRTFPNRDGQTLKVTRGLPDGAKVEAVSMDAYFALGEVAMRVSHPSWPETAPGFALPEMTIEYEMEVAPHVSLVTGTG